MGSLLLSWLIGAQPVAAERPKPAYPQMRDRSKYGRMGDPALDAHIRRYANRRSVRRRLVLHSWRMLGANYRDDALGEGQGASLDSEPRWRLAPVDCQTFVETDLALSLGGDLAEARRWLDRIRYRGDAVGYAQRNHFMVGQWVPHLQRLGILREATERFAGGPVELLSVDYEAIDWAAIPRRFLPQHFAREQAPKGQADLPYMTIDHFAEIVDAVPSGTLLLLVRAARSRIPVRVSHLGFVVRTKPGDRAVFRHASREGWGRVVDEDLVRYLQRLQANARWPAIGVNLQAPRHPGVHPSAPVPR
jgi:hypothetical protein